MKINQIHDYEGVFVEVRVFIQFNIEFVVFFALAVVECKV